MGSGWPQTIVTSSTLLIGQNSGIGDEWGGGEDGQRPEPLSAPLNLKKGGDCGQAQNMQISLLGE